MSNIRSEDMTDNYLTPIGSDNEEKICILDEITFFFKNNPRYFPPIVFFLFFFSGLVQLVLCRDMFVGQFYLMIMFFYVVWLALVYWVLCVIDPGVVTSGKSLPPIPSSLTTPQFTHQASFLKQPTSQYSQNPLLETYSRQNIQYNLSDGYTSPELNNFQNNHVNNQHSSYTSLDGYNQPRDPLNNSLVSHRNFTGYSGTLSDSHVLHSNVSNIVNTTNYNVSNLTPLHSHSVPRNGLSSPSLNITTNSDNSQLPGVSPVLGEPSVMMMRNVPKLHPTLSQNRISSNSTGISSHHSTASQFNGVVNSLDVGVGVGVGVGSNSPHYCNLCRLNRSPHTHTSHCRECNVCIRGRQLHCPWLNQCVGSLNVTVYLHLMLFLCLWCILCFCTTVYYFVLYVPISPPHHVNPTILEISGNIISHTFKNHIYLLFCASVIYLYVIIQTSTLFTRMLVCVERDVTIISLMKMSKSTNYLNNYENFNSHSKSPKMTDLSSPSYFPSNNSNSSVINGLGLDSSETHTIMKHISQIWTGVVNFTHSIYSFIYNLYHSSPSSPHTNSHSIISRPSPLSKNTLSQRQLYICILFPVVSITKLGRIVVGIYDGDVSVVDTDCNNNNSIWQNDIV